MNTIINPSVHENRLCPKCGAAGAESDIVRNAYRCGQCSYELAHVDLAANGAVRGVFGWLKGVGDVIGERYKIQTVLGKGGFGATYLVEDQRVKGKRWALKEIPEMLFDEFEVALLSHLDHPAIPIIADRFTENGMVYLVLKFGGNRTLASETKNKGRIAYADLKGLVLQIGNVLEYLHGREPPIIHRDLKPENVLLDDAGRIMVIDFGIAKESAPATMTRTLGRAASYGFSPPEQIMGTGTDSRSDIYSLAATVYFALTGQTPVAAHERVAGKPLPAPKSLAPELPDAVNDMVLRGLNLNINERPQTVREFLEVFGAAQGSTTEMLMSGKTVQISDLHFGPVINTQVNRSQPLSAPPAAAGASQRSAVIILIGAILTLTAIAGGGIFWFLHQKTEPEAEKEPQSAAVTVPAPVSSGAPPAPATLAPAATAPATVAPPAAALPASPTVQQQSSGPSAMDVLNQRRQAQPEEEPQADKTPNAAAETLRRTAPQKAAVEAKKYTAKPAARSKPKVEARNTPEPAPAPATKKESSSWVIIPGQTQKKY